MNDEFMSCNGFGSSPVQMISGLLHSKKYPNWFQFVDRDVIFTHQGRNAIALICQLLNIGKSDEVIVPAYNCGAEIDPFVVTGANIVFYRIDNKAMIDADDIICRVTPATKIIYITHFFGWPQDIREIAEWSKKKGIFLVEDCAQALFSKGPDSTIGQIGDAAIYSFVKSLPVPDGGALVLKKNIWNKSKEFRLPQKGIVLRGSLPLLKRWFMHTNKLWQRYEFTRTILTKNWLINYKGQHIEPRHEMLKSNYFDKNKIDWSISRLSTGLLGRIDPNEVMKKRRLNYQHLGELILNTDKVQPLFSHQPDDVCPLSFPVFVKDRRRWYSALTDKGIQVLGWPGYYPGFNWDDFPETCNLKDNILTLPVHQKLDISHIEYIASSVKSIAKAI